MVIPTAVRFHVGPTFYIGWWGPKLQIPWPSFSERSFNVEDYGPGTQDELLINLESRLKTLYSRDIQLVYAAGFSHPPRSIGLGATQTWLYPSADLPCFKYY